ncbi:hypothetical protein B0H11DRAFT_2272779 [Mycena galericulata]|nr:hypothetical protein B0H11DRAFT_2272779 [Mycena galericulata]
MPTIQIATFPVSEAFTSKPEIFEAPLTVISTADGHISSFYGAQVEDPKIGYFVSVWESYEHHQKLISDPNYASLVEGLKPAAAGKFERNHINVNGDVNTALSSPAVEFVVFTLKAEGSTDKFVSLMGDLAKGLDTSAGEHPPCAWGQSVEENNRYLLIVGWDTVAAHWEAVKEGTALHKVIGAILEHADLTIGHAHIKKHQG